MKIFNKLIKMLREKKFIGLKNKNKNLNNNNASIKQYLNIYYYYFAIIGKKKKLEVTIHGLVKINYLFEKMKNLFFFFKSERERKEALKCILNTFSQNYGNN